MFARKWFAPYMVAAHKEEQVHSLQELLNPSFVAGGSGGLVGQESLFLAPVDTSAPALSAQE